jgi:hypothetical protein
LSPAPRPFTLFFGPDLSPAFDWNIKQLFVFLVVEYESKKNVSNFSLFPQLNPFHAPCHPLFHEKPHALGLEPGRRVGPHH